MDHNLVTTAFSIDGYRVNRNLGVVRGIVVRSRSLFGTIGASLQTLVGGNITLFTQLCEKTRNDAFELMITTQKKSGQTELSAFDTMPMKSWPESPKFLPTEPQFTSKRFKYSI